MWRFRGKGVRRLYIVRRVDFYDCINVFYGIKKNTFTQSYFFGGGWSTLFCFFWGGELYSDSESGCSVTKKQPLSFLSRVTWQFLVRKNLHSVCIMFSTLAKSFFFVAVRSIGTTQQMTMLYYSVQLVTRRFNLTALTVPRKESQQNDHRNRR